MRTIDESAFADRLYADALAAELRKPRAFLEHSVWTSWGALEPFMRARSDVYQRELAAMQSLAERALGRARERWGGPEPGSEKERVVSMLHRAAGGLLQPDGSDMVLRVDCLEPGREILRWRFVSLVLPPSVLIAAATPRGARPPTTVRLLHTSIAPDGPVAHQHVHHAAMMSFEELWASLRLNALLFPTAFMESIRSERAKCPGLHSGTCPSLEGPGGQARSRARLIEHTRHLSEWGDLLRQAFIARQLLDDHAYHRGKLASCLDPLCVKGRMMLRAFLAGRVRPYSAGLTPYPWSGERYQLGRQLREATAPSLPGRSGRVRRDLLQRLAQEECSLLARAFEYSRAHKASSPEPRTDELGSPDPQFDQQYELLLLQYLRVKTAVFRRLVHSPGERGLKHFIEHFQQIKVYAPELPASVLLRPRGYAEPGLDVRAVERRVSPDAWPQRCERLDREDKLPGNGGPSPCEKAWLVHFQRRPPRQGTPLFGAAMKEMEVDARRMERALRADPARLKSLRGIDLAGEEGAQPLWVAAETLRSIRARSNVIAGAHPRLKLQPLRLTLHAGEDFKWLTTGVRAVAEPFLWRLIQRGDRIGHGIAITFDPQAWWGRHEGRVVYVSRFDRLLDLAFLAEYTRHETMRPGRSADQDAWLAREIRRIVRQLNFEREPDLNRLSDVELIEVATALWCKLGSKRARRILEVRHWPFDPERRHECWIHRYLWNRSTRDKAQEKIPMMVDDDRDDLRVETTRNECDLLVIARKRLIREVARWQVAIESNPSSNLVVAGLDAMGAAQDFLQRRPTLREEGEGADETLTWTISTDDPISFSTTLADEYAYAWAGMVLRAGRYYDPPYARALLDEAAATSMRTRFTVPPHA